MIKNILRLLEVSDFMGVSQNIDIAKGANELTLNPRKVYKQKTRKWLSKR